MRYLITQEQVDLCLHGDADAYVAVLYSLKPIEPLTEDRIKEMSEEQWGKEYGYFHYDEIQFARAIESAHGIKEQS